MTNCSIPKKIHYCWFGRNPKPELLQNCIESWKKYCPDYEIIEWNEDNFDIKLCNYTEQAYDKKKYAFVSDVARVWIVNKFGGIYLDTDVELKENIDFLLKYDAWFATEGIQNVATGLGFGAKAGNFVVKAILDDYLTRDFESLEPCVKLNTKVIKDTVDDFEFADKTRTYDGVCIFSSADYHKFATHHYAASWTDNKEKKKDKKIKWKIFHFFENPRMIRYCNTHNNIFSKIYMFFVYEFIACGVGHCFRIIFKRK
ncbi:MAG: glycosyltransferase family 32 protein [Ruminococcus sp.]